MRGRVNKWVENTWNYGGGGGHLELLSARSLTKYAFCAITFSAT